MSTILNWQQDGAELTNGASPVLITIILPLNHNDGRDVEPEQLDHILSGLLQYAGGLTQLAPGIGFWCLFERFFKDRILPVQVVVSNFGEAEAWLTQWLLDTTAQLEQEQIFCFMQSIYLVEFQSVASTLDEVLLLG